MRLTALICVIIAVVSLVVGIVSRLMVTPMGPGGLESRAFAGFSAVMLLLAIALSALKK